MKLPLRIARRYLFAKKSTNAINIITGIAIFGIAVGTTALVLVLSVFNGFEVLITGMYSSFNPDVKITAARGKTFAADSSLIEKVKSVEGVAVISETLEEVAFFEYKNNQDFGRLKGVDDQYTQVTNLDSMVREGAYSLSENQRPTAVLGVGMRNKLNVNVDDVFSAMSVYMPKRREVGLFEKQFRTKLLYPTGTFVIQQDYDNQYVFTSLRFVRELLGHRGPEVSALELQLRPGYNTSATLARLQEAVGPEYRVRNRYEQEEAFMKLMQIEKWLSFAIVGLMMLLISFNIVGALWMIVLEKRPDISILKAMGARANSVRNIFLYEGLLLCGFGLVVGFVLALGVYLFQKNFGIVAMPGNMIIEAYPIELRWPDFLVVALTVLSIGLLASIPPALRAKRVPAIIREE